MSSRRANEDVEVLFTQQVAFTVGVVEFFCTWCSSIFLCALYPGVCVAVLEVGVCCIFKEGSNAGGDQSSCSCEGLLNKTALLDHPCVAGRVVWRGRDDLGGVVA